MKPLFVVICFMLNIAILKAQNNEFDKIVMLNGEHIAAIVTNISERTVTYTYAGESLSHTRSINTIKEILFSSGRKEAFNQRVIIRSEDDWHKVVLTNIPEEVEGLVKKGEVYVKSTATTIFSGAAKIDEKSSRKIKKEAARMGAHVVFLRGQNNDRGIRRTNRSVKSGVAYGYE